MKWCLNCDGFTSGYAKYCSNQCQSDFAYKSYILKWKLGNVSGNRGVNTQNLSGHVIRYLLEQAQEHCSQCGWCTPNPYDGKVPLEIDHIDGNANNSCEANLRVLCPNCHALTNNFKNKNKGRGREWRRTKYKQNDTPA